MYSIYLKKTIYKRCKYFYFRLVCRCLERLSRLSEGNLSIYNQFTIQNYGECWSSKYGYDSLHTFKKSNDCVGAGFLDCHDHSMMECTGTKRASFLYQVNNRTKLMDEHCHIVRRIVCPSSLTMQNSSSHIPLVGNLTVFTHPITDGLQHTASKVLQNSTAPNTVSEKLLQNHTTASLQNTTPQFIQNLTFPIHDTISQIQMTSLTKQSNIKTTSQVTKFKQSTSRKHSNGTDSMLSQLQTLNTGKLYISGSKLQNVTLAPTQFFVGSSILYTNAKSPEVEYSNYYYRNTSSLASEKSSETVLLTITNAELISSVTAYSVSPETTVQTTRLNVTLFSINTSPIKATLTLTSQSTTLHQNTSNLQPDKSNQSPLTLISQQTASTFLQRTVSTSEQSMVLLFNSTQRNKISTSNSSHCGECKTSSRQSFGNHSSIEPEVSSTAMPTNVQTTVNLSRFSLNKTSCESVLNQSCTSHISSVHSTTSFIIRSASANVHPSLSTEETTSTIHITKSRESEPSSPLLWKESSKSYFTSSSLKGHLSSSRIETKSTLIKANSETTLSRSTNIIPSNPEGNSAPSKPTMFLISIVLQFIIACE